MYTWTYVLAGTESGEKSTKPNLTLFIRPPTHSLDSPHYQKQRHFINCVVLPFPPSAGSRRRKEWGRGEFFLLGITAHLQKKGEEWKTYIII